MAFYPAHCDDNCKGCIKNECGWCIWKDTATPYYKTEAFKAQNIKLDDIVSEWQEEINVEELIKLTTKIARPQDYVDGYMLS